MRDDAHAIEGQRPARSDENTRLGGEHAVARTVGTADPRSTSTGREAPAIPDGEPGHLHPEPPRRHPLVPVLALRSLALLHVIDLPQAIADRAERQSELQPDDRRAVDQPMLLGDAEAE